MLASIECRGKHTNHQMQRSVRACVRGYCQYWTSLGPLTLSECMLGLWRWPASDCHAADGLITYMRSDSPSLEEDPAEFIRDAAGAIWGKEYLANAPKLYKWVY